MFKQEGDKRKEILKIEKVMPPLKVTDNSYTINESQPSIESSQNSQSQDNSQENRKVMFPNI